MFCYNRIFFINFRNIFFGIFIKNRFQHIAFWILAYTLFVVANSVHSIAVTTQEFSFIDVEDGLSQNSVSSIYQDNFGFIWIGTADGLNRYDGYNFRIFRNNTQDSNSIENNFVNTIFHSHLNGFWVGTDIGLSFYNNSTGHFKNYNLNRIINSGVVIDNDNLCFLTSVKGLTHLYKFNIKSKKTTHVFSTKDYFTNFHVKIKKDFKGRIWLSSTKKVYRMSDDASKVIDTGIESPDGSSIVEFIVSNKGRILLSTEKNIYLLNDDFSIKEKLNLNPEYSKISFCDLDMNNNIWIGAKDTNGFASFNLLTKEFKRYPVLSIKQPFSLTNLKCQLIDKSGVVWLGSDGGGITKYNPYQRKFQLLTHDPKNPNSLSVNFPKGMVVDSKNNLWVGTIKGGLNKFDINNNKWEHYNPEKNGIYFIPQDVVISVFEDSKGTIWFSGNSSKLGIEGIRIDTFNNKYQRFTTFLQGKETQKFFEDSDGNMWFTGNTLISKYDRKMDTLINLSNEALDDVGTNYLRVYSISQTYDKNIWVGIGNGILRFDYNMKLVKSYTYNTNDIHSISHSHVLTLLKDSKGRLWAGTRDGLNLYLPETDNFHRFDTRSGLPNSFIYGILEDKNDDYWISTNNGLSRLRYIDTNHYSFRNYKMSDGLQSNEFNTDAYTKSKNGYLFFGGIGGISYFHPDSVKDNKHIPNVVITAVNLFDLPYNAGINTHLLKHLTFPYNENTLSFEFSALEFSSPSLNQYAYYMSGVDTGWVYSGDKRFARYANLKPGKYIFKVKASNNDEVWNETGTSIEILIKPPFWASIEFRILVILSVIGFIGFVYQFRIRSIEQRNILLEKTIIERTEELRKNNEQLEQQALEIKSINESLEKRVEERTIELKDANEKLQVILKEITDSKAESLKSIIKTQEDERSRFAKDLHDGASQYLTFLKFNINNVISKIDDNHKDVKENLKEQLKLIDNIVQELRQFAYSLMPPVLERIGLNAAIEELLEIFKSSTNIRIEYYLQDKRKPLPKYYKIQLYRIIQEILNNCVKHSKCTKINFQLLTYPSNILIIIEDNGIGFDSTSVKSGMGLKNLHSRLALVNGKIDFDSQINHGTTITIEVPN